jgi:hypothetical protein
MAEPADRDPRHLRHGCQDLRGQFARHQCSLLDLRAELAVELGQPGHLALQPGDLVAEPIVLLRDALAGVAARPEARGGQHPGKRGAPAHRSSPGSLRRPMGLGG